MLCTQCAFYGCTRISTFDQDLASQHAVLAAAGCVVILVEQASVYRGR